MLNKPFVLLLRSLTLLCFFFLVLSVSLLNVEAVNDLHHEEDASEVTYLVKKGERKSLVETEYGKISGVKIFDGTRGPYHLQFITLEPNSLFLPVLLHAGMVFYVHTGSGRLSWADEKDTVSLNIKRGDVYRLQPGSIFFMESDLEPEKEKLRIYAMFSNIDEESFEPAIGAYTSISDLVLGFDDKVLQSAFKVSEDLIEALRNSTRPPPIIHALPREEKKSTFWEFENRFLKASVGGGGFNIYAISGNKKKAKTYNVFDADPDFSNCNGWSLTVNRKHLKSLKHSNIGVFMVNLTKGSMMGPHWNPMATEIAIVLHGEGMIRVVCPTTAKSCKNMRFMVQEGDVFVVHRFHPMAQMSFNNDSFVFMGFSATRRRNYPQFLAGKSSAIQKLDKRVVAMSFNVSNTTITHLLAQQAESVILDCTSCAEEEESIMEEEIEKEREEEEAKKREEEEKKRREEEEESEEEEGRKREEEEEGREDEEAKKREEEEEREREEEEAKKKEEEEEERKREEEEEEERRREKEKDRQEEKRRRDEEREKQEEERRRREEAAKEEEEEARRQEEERQRREEEEEEPWRRERDNEGGRGQRRILKHVSLEGFILVP